MRGSTGREEDAFRVRRKSQYMALAGLIAPGAMRNSLGRDSELRLRRAAPTLSMMALVAWQLRKMVD